LAVLLVADFEALSYQVTTNFDKSCAARIRTAPAINYTACYRLVFFCLSSETIVNIEFCCHCHFSFLSVRVSQFFIFLSVGKFFKTILLSALALQAL